MIYRTKLSFIAGFATILLLGILPTISLADNQVGSPTWEDPEAIVPIPPGKVEVSEPQQGPPPGGAQKSGPGDVTWSEPKHYNPDGSISFLSGSKAGDPLDIALDYLRRNKGALGLTESDLADVVVKDRYVSQHNGVTHLYLRQQLGGIEVFNGDININIDRDGRVINVGNGFVSNLKDGVKVKVASISAAEAVNRAAQHLGLTITDPLVPRRTIGGPAQEVVLSDGGISLEDIPVKLMYLPQSRSNARLVWEAVIRLRNNLNWWNIRVDAATGDILSQNDWIVNDNYRVFALPLEFPGDGPHSLEANPADPVASPFGWHDTDGVAGAEFTDTRGNNVFAQEDTDADNSGGFRPDGGATLLFDFPFDPALDPADYQPAAITNLFYWNNILHDIHYHYGFDEVSGNFQQSNYGRGGRAGDPVQADAQDGSDTDNANFATPPDAFDPRMQMFRWTFTAPNRDSDLDNGIIIHEYGHGVSNRLSGGPSNSNCLFNFEEMGEGWSDWWTLALTAKVGDGGADARGVGTYVLGQPPDEPGIRNFAYSTDLGINPQTYDAIKGASSPHDVGEVWAAMLWEVYWNLVDAYGFDPDFYQGNGGNNLAMQLVMDGLKLQNCSPSFVDGRDAILLADQINNGGANQCHIWNGFAKRGLGVSADAGSENSFVDGVEAFDVPTQCSNDLALTKTVNPDLVFVGEELTYTLVAGNYSATALTGIMLTDPVPDNTAYVPGSASDGGSESGGVVEWDLGPMAPGAVVTRTFRVTVDPLPAPLFSDDMESGAGNWTVAHGLGSQDWALDTSNPHSGTTAWFAPDPFDVSDQFLILDSPILLPADSTLSFWHHYATESSYDGGVVEISTNAGIDWLDLGPNMIQNGYNGSISTEFGSPIGGQPAFTGDSGGYLKTVVDLNGFSGQSVLVRFRMATDIIVGAAGWYVDDVRIGVGELISNTASVSALEGNNDSDLLQTTVSEGALLYYNPAGIEKTMLPNQVMTTTVTISNPGVLPLTFFARDKDVPASCNLLIISNAGFETGEFNGWTAVDENGTWLVNEGTYQRIIDAATTAPLTGSFSALADEYGPGTNTLYQDIAIPADLSGAVSLRWLDQWENHAGIFANNQEFRVALYGPDGTPFLGEVFSTGSDDPLLSDPTSREVDVTALVTPYAGQSVRLQIEVESLFYFFNVQIDEVQLCQSDAVWVTTPADSDTVPPGSSTTIDVVFNSGTVPGDGDYQAELTFSGNMGKATTPQNLIMHVRSLSRLYLPLIVKSK